MWLRLFEKAPPWTLPFWAVFQRAVSPRASQVLRRAESCREQARPALCSRPGRAHERMVSQLQIDVDLSEEAELRRREDGNASAQPQLADGHDPRLLSIDREVALRLDRAGQRAAPSDDAGLDVESAAVPRRLQEQGCRPQAVDRLLWATWQIKHRMQAPSKLSALEIPRHPPKLRSNFGRESSMVVVDMNNQGRPSISTTVEPPVNFGLVSAGVYRSGFPCHHNLVFLRGLGLRTLVRLEAASYSPAVQGWIGESGIRAISLPLSSNKEPFVVMDPAALASALEVISDPANHPVLVHGLRGLLRTGVLVGCYRRLQSWSLAAIFEEYRRFAGVSSSLLDLQYIELFDCATVLADGREEEESPAVGIEPATRV